MTRKFFMILAMTAALSVSSCCVFQHSTPEIDKGFLESTLKVNDTILSEYKEYVENDKVLDQGAKMARLYNLKAYRRLLRDRADEYNSTHPAK